MIADAAISLLPEPKLLIGDRRVGEVSGGHHEHIYAATGLGAIDIQFSDDEIAELDAMTRQKARYPNLRWLPDNSDAETMRGAVGKSKV